MSVNRREFFRALAGSLTVAAGAPVAVAAIDERPRAMVIRCQDELSHAAREVIGRAVKCFLDRAGWQGTPVLMVENGFEVQLFNEAIPHNSASNPNVDNRGNRRGA